MREVQTCPVCRGFGENHFRVIPYYTDCVIICFTCKGSGKVVFEATRPYSLISELNRLQQVDQNNQCGDFY